jgi:hypothetical protein
VLCLAKEAVTVYRDPKKDLPWAIMHAALNVADRVIGRWEFGVYEQHGDSED